MLLGYGMCDVIKESLMGGHTISACRLSKNNYLCHLEVGKLTHHVSLRRHGMLHFYTADKTVSKAHADIFELT